MYEYPVRLSEVYQAIVDYGIATEDEVDLCTGIHGFNREELNNIVYYRTGYNDIRQFIDEEVHNNDVL